MNLSKTTVGVVQATPALFDLKASIERLEPWLQKGKQEGCQLLLFPESFLPCYPRGLSYDARIGRRSEESKELWLDYWKNALEIPSPEWRRLSMLVASVGLYVAIGVTERDPLSGSLYCSLLYIDPKGMLIGKHRKLKPTGLERYLWGEGDGKDLGVLPLPFGNLGGLICWENYMPEARLSLYRQGINIYLAPTADSRGSWQSTLQHIALEGRCYVLGCNQFVCREDYPERYQKYISDEPEIMCPGGSVVYGPDGSCLAGPLWDSEGLLKVEIDPDVWAKSKLEFDAIGHYSRPAVFG